VVNFVQVVDLGDDELPDRPTRGQQLGDRLRTDPLGRRIRASVDASGQLGGDVELVRPAVRPAGAGTTLAKRPRSFGDGRRPS
jgi:hypothetical protein